MLHHTPPQKEMKHIQISAVDLLYTVQEQEILIGANADIAKRKQEKQIVFVVKRWMQRLFVQ